MSRTLGRGTKTILILLGMMSAVVVIEVLRIS